MRLKMPDARPIKVVVATSAMLSFISFWRAAAIVLNDLGSSAYYAPAGASTVSSRKRWAARSVNSLSQPLCSITS